MKNHNKTLLATLIGATLASSPVFSQDSQAEQEIKITVKDSKQEGVASEKNIDAQAVKDSPAGNGNLSDYLTTVPAVRAAGDEQDGFTKGEIKPMSISINGADASQTGYFIDGVNVNNDLMSDAAHFDGSMQVNPRTHSEQGYFFDARMFGNIKVYTDNVPASLGGFTGGAVVAETRQYQGHNKVSASYRTTNDSWSSTQVDANAKAIFNKAQPDGDSAIFQPDYDKHSFNVMVEQQLGGDWGLVFGASRRTSDIMQLRQISIDGKTATSEHTRLSSNVLANINWTPDIDRNLEIGLRYSNYEEGKYYAEVLNNNVTDSHLAYGTTVRWQQRLGGGSMSVRYAFDRMQDGRDSNSSTAKVVSIMDEDFNSFDYTEGGYGDSDLTQDTHNLSMNYEFDRMTLGDSSHKVELGAQMTRTRYDFTRHNDVHTSMEIKMPWFEDTSSEVIRKGEVKTSHENYAIYAQNNIVLGAFTFRPGIRVERDDYLENTNVAPRFVTQWQALENTRFSLGLNRYYGRSFAGMKLSEKVAVLNNDTSKNFASVDNIDTPFADEVSVGMLQNFGNLTFAANYTLRKNRDRIMYVELGDKLEGYRNGADYDVDVYTLQISNRTPWTFGPTHWTTSLGTDFIITDRSDLAKSFDPNELVILDGKPMTRAQMEREVNSSEEEWVVRAGISMNMPELAVTWGNNVTVKAPIQGSEEMTVDANGITMYKSFDYGTHTQWDTRLRWQPSLFSTHSMYVQADVLNVLNQVRKTGVKSGSNGDYGMFTPGREFWLELGYEF